MSATDKRPGEDLTPGGAHARAAAVPPVRLLAIGAVRLDWLELLATLLPETIPIHFEIAAEPQLEAPSWIRRGEQIDAESVLAGVAPAPGIARTLALIDRDLFLPALTYVFGAARLAGSAAVVSLHRLRPEAYGLEPDEDRLAARLEKEALHELGHLFELRHCREPECVMRFSSSIEEVDEKPPAFCGACGDLLHAALRKPVVYTPARTNARRSN